MRKSLSIVIALLFSLFMLNAEEQKPETSPGLGKLKKPFGTVLTVQGKIVPKFGKGTRLSGPHILVQKINGHAVREYIVIQLFPYQWTFRNAKELDKFEFGKTYELTGFETGYFAGMPKGIYEKYYKSSTTQFLLFNFTHQFAVWKTREIPPLDYPPPKAVDRIAAPQFIGKLKKPLGTVFTVQGKIISGFHKGYEGGPNIIIQKINGRATQEYIRLPLTSYENYGLNIDKFQYGKSYEFEGFETGDFVGMPEKIYEGYCKNGMPPQTGIFHFTFRFAVYKAKKIKPLVFSPSDFIDRFALIEGKGVNKGKSACIISKNWTLIVDPAKPWPDYFINKTVEGRGIIRKTDKPNIWKLENPETHLVKLKDQIKHKVKLRGTAWSRNQDWWLDYRGTTVFVENMDKLPGWNTYKHGEPVMITGLLEEKMMPEIGNPKVSKKSFFIRSPSWKTIKSLLSPERH